VAVQPNFVVDWEALLEQLRALEIRTSDISSHTGISRQALGEYRQGIKTPLHSRGEALIQFWCRMTGKPREALPMTTALPSIHVGR
jgi:hypothetical protein